MLCKLQLDRDLMGINSTFRTGNQLQMGSSSGASSAKKGKNEVGKEQIQGEAVSFSDLPSDIMENVFYRLSVKRIVVCKSVCKTWYKIISDPEFVKQHFDRGQICPLVRSSGPTFLSRILYLVEEEKVGSIPCIHETCATKEPNGRCPLCLVKDKLDTKLRIPLRNFESIPKNMLTIESNEGRYNLMKLKMKDHNYKVVNSCNGFLCLSKPYDNDPVIVCNPITGEFINLPKSRTFKCPELYSLELRQITSGFGFSQTTNQYKVVRTFLKIREGTVVAEVHVLGTKSWKGIDRSNHRRGFNLFPTSLNGFLYWRSKDFVLSFDIDKECFSEVPLPPLKPYTQHGNVAMGILGRELCITEVVINDVNIWAMNNNNNGAEERWSKLFTFHQFGRFQIWPHGPLLPIKYINERALLMFSSRLNGFIYKDQENLEYRCIRVRGMGSQMEAIAHRPSFISLSNILSGLDAEVLNVNARCGPLLLHNEAKLVSLLEEDD